MPLFSITKYIGRFCIFLLSYARTTGACAGDKEMDTSLYWPKRMMPRKQQIARTSDEHAAEYDDVDEEIGETSSGMIPTQREPSLWAGSRNRGVFDVFQRQDSLLRDAQGSIAYSVVTDTVSDAQKQENIANPVDSDCANTTHRTNSFLQLRRMGMESVYTLIQGKPCMVGRGAECDIRIRDDAHLSHRHAMLVCVHDGVILSDLGSLNGTWVDGRRIASGERVRIPVGGVFHLSKIAFRVERVSSGQ
jgi:hypothetical protein